MEAIAMRSMWQRLLLVAFLLVLATSYLPAQSAGAAGTIQGKVVDPTGAVIPGATVEIKNPVTGFTRTATTEADGTFIFRNIPLNPYHTVVTAKGFSAAAQDLDVRSGVPIDVSIQLPLGTANTTVEVNSTASDLLEN